MASAAELGCVTCMDLRLYYITHTSLERHDDAETELFRVKWYTNSALVGA